MSNLVTAKYDSAGNQIFDDNTVLRVLSQVFIQPDATGTWPDRPNGLVITVPVWAKFLNLTLCTSGGGGGSGRRGASLSARSGGAGGQPGLVNSFRIPLRDASGNLLASTGTLTVAASVAGGAAVTTDDTNGNAGTICATSSFVYNGNIFSVNSSGSAAPGGTAVSVNAAAGVAGKYASANPAATNVTAAVAAAFPTGIVGPGSPGGSISTADALLTTGGSNLVQGGAGTLSVTTPGADGIGVQRGDVMTAVGAAGGAASSSAAAQNGGNGIYGSGGGGGGASLNGFNSGAGGRGGAGWAILFWE